MPLHQVRVGRRLGRLRRHDGRAFLGDVHARRPHAPPALHPGGRHRTPRDAHALPPAGVVRRAACHFPLAAVRDVVTMESVTKATDGTLHDAHTVL